MSAWHSGALDMALPNHFLDELARVLPRLHDRLKLSDSERLDLVDSRALMADVVDVDAALKRLLAAAVSIKDAADLPVLATLTAADAAYLSPAGLARAG